MRSGWGRSFIIAVLMSLAAVTAFAQMRPAGTTVSITYSYDLNGQVTVADYGSRGRISYVYDKAGNVTNLEITSTNTGTLSCNYTTGGLGSFITIRGTGFPSDASVLILINGVGQAPPVVCDGSGNFVCVLDMSLAGAGVYNVTAVVVTGSAAEAFAPSAAGATFMIIAGAPVRAREGGTGSAPTFTVPAGLALEPLKAFLPLIIR